VYDHSSQPSTRLSNWRTRYVSRETSLPSGPTVECGCVGGSDSQQFDSSVVESARQKGFHVKHSEAQSIELLTDLCKEAGLTVSAEKIDRMVCYLAGVVEMNQSVNLTRIETMAAGVRLHLLDSLLVQPEISACIEGSICDIGTGGGFPGVPLAILTGRPCVALDSVGKKANAVNEILTALGIDDLCKALPERAEAYARRHPGQHAVVTARALAPLPSIVELAAPLLSPGGTLIAYKGAPSDDELESGEVAARIVGLRRSSARKLVLPSGDERRMIICYTKDAISSIALPRREGSAQHDPLA